MYDHERKHLEETCKNKNLYYILITCTKPSESNEMEVQMSYNGDVDLVSFLLENASAVLDQEEVCLS